MELRDITVLVTLLVGSGGILGGIYALLKLRPEAGQITVSTAQGVLIMQTTVIADLRTENDRLLKRIETIEADYTKRSERNQARIDALEAENTELRQRLEDIEQKLSQLEGG